MPTTLTATDDLISPVVVALSTALTAQIINPPRMYLEVPDGPPETHSMLFPVASYKFEPDDLAPGKEKVRITFGIRYLVRKSRFSDNMLSLYKMFSAMSQILTSWGNQNLGGASLTVSPKSGGFTQFNEAGTVYVALIMNTDVLIEFNNLIN